MIAKYSKECWPRKGVSLPKRFARDDSAAEQFGTEMLYSIVGWKEHQTWRIRLNSRLWSATDKLCDSGKVIVLPFFFFSIGKMGQLDLTIFNILYNFRRMWFYGPAEIFLSWHICRASWSSNEWPHWNGHLKYSYCQFYAYTEEVAVTQEGQGRVLPSLVSNEPLFKSVLEM